MHTDMDMDIYNYGYAYGYGYVHVCKYIDRDTHSLTVCIHIHTRDIHVPD